MTGIVKGWKALVIERKQFVTPPLCTSCLQIFFLESEITRTSLPFLRITRHLQFVSGPRRSSSAPDATAGKKLGRAMRSTITVVLCKMADTYTYKVV